MKRALLIAAVMSVTSWGNARASEVGPCMEANQKQKVACLNVRVGRLEKPPVPTPVPVPVPDAKQWAIGCTNGVCAAVNEKGSVVYLDQSQKQIVGGPSPLPGNVKAPMTIACSSVGAGEGCLIIDASGQVWLGGARPPFNYLQLNFKMP